MFSIGSTLREARELRGLTLRDAEAATRIRSKYLAALEDERFDALPEEVYVRGFLRAYAEFLGLEGELFAAEFNARLEASRPPPPPEPERRLVLPALDLRTSLVAIGCAVAATTALLAWRLGDGTGRQTATTIPLESSGTTTHAAPSPQPSGGGQSSRLRLALSAAAGDCWLSVRRASREGEVLFEGMLVEGDSLRFTGKRFWVRMGAPWNLTVKLDGKALRDLPTRTANVSISRAGLHPA